MTTPRITTFPHIVRVPGVVGGEPVIAGTRVSVRILVQFHRMYGNFDELDAAYPRVSLAAAEEALAYYATHQEEIDRYIAENEGDE